MKLTVKQIMFLIMSVLLVLVVVMGAVVFSRVSGLFQLSAAPDTDNGPVVTPSSSVITPESSAASSSAETTLPQETTAPHVHEYTKKETLSASCDAGGYTIYYCACGKADPETMVTTNPLGHKYGDYTVVAATCETDGWTERTCSRCKTVERTNPTKAGHTFGAWANIAVAEGDPTQEMRTCSACKVTEIRSLDTSKTWVIRKSTLDPDGIYTHYQIIVDLADSDSDPTYEIYTGLINKTIHYDYSESGLTVSYTVADAPMNYIVPSGTTVLTIYADGTVVSGKPAQTPDPTPSTGPSTGTSTGTSEPATQPIEPATQPSEPVTSTPESEPASQPASSGPADNGNT